MRARGRIGNTGFEFEVPPEFEEYLRIDPTGLMIRYRASPAFLCAEVVEPCDCEHARVRHELGLQSCMDCECTEWWKP